MQAQKLEHKLSEAWAQHAGEVLQQIAAHEAEADRLEGKATAQRREAAFMRKHLSVTIDKIAKTEKLPEPLRPYQLSDDGSKIVGLVMPPEPPADPPTEEGKANGVADETR